MNAQDRPAIDAYRRQLLVCVGPYCTQDGMTPDVERVVDEHLVGGRAVADLVFHQGPGGGYSTPPAAPVEPQ